MWVPYIRIWVSGSLPSSFCPRKNPVCNMSRRSQSPANRLVAGPANLFLKKGAPDLRLYNMSSERPRHCKMSVSRQNRDHILNNTTLKSLFTKRLGHKNSRSLFMIANWVIHVFNQIQERDLEFRSLSEIETCDRVCSTKSHFDTSLPIWIEPLGMLDWGTGLETNCPW